MNINNVTIIGAGTMGNGIAQVFAMQKYNVVLCDINEMALLKGMKSIQTNLDRMVKRMLSAIQLNNLPLITFRPPWISKKEYLRLI